MKQKNIVQFLIEQSGLTQKEFALKVGTSEAQLSRYKKIPDSITYSTVVEWANKLNIKI